jgi:hypothetical protein
MNISLTYKRKAVRVGALLAALLVIVGCAGIQPYEPRNHREEGMKQGLFSGPEGEFTIFRKGKAPRKSGDNDKVADEKNQAAPADDTQ